MGGACTKAGIKPAAGLSAKRPADAVSEISDADSEAKDVIGEVQDTNFRNRRLTMSQVPDPKSGDRSERLSVYGGGSEQDVGLVVEAVSVTTIAAKSIPGLEPVPGGAVAKINQDRAVALHPFASDNEMALLGVYDGHGKQGEQVSAFVKEQLPGIIERHPLLLTQPAQALHEAYVSCDDLLRASQIEASVSGTTAVTVLVRGRSFWVANAGDSRAVIGRWSGDRRSMVAHDVSFDQKPDTPAEMKRIIAAGGHVTPAGANGSPARVWHNFRGLAMARSIGDHNASTVGVIAEPEVHQYAFHEDDAVCIIGSDGVWELLESQQVVDIATQHAGEPTEDVVDRIIERAAHMWKVEEGDYRDDISCIVLRVPWLEPSGAPTS